ncbi:MAG: restriction endonuclease, partial [Myxococcales bacterium]
RGEPQDPESARVLAETSPYEFQWWAVHKVGAHAVGGEPGSRYGKRGRDRGVDGLLKFRTSPQSQVFSIVVSVKGGRVINPAMVRELRGTLERERAAMGVLLTLGEPTAEMRREAAMAGFFKTKAGRRQYPRIQLIAVSDIFAGRRIEYPGDEVERSESRPQAVLPGLERIAPPPRKGVLVTVPEKGAERPTPFKPAREHQQDLDASADSAPRTRGRQR